MLGKVSTEPFSTFCVAGCGVGRDKAHSGNHYSVCGILHDVFMWSMFLVLRVAFKSNTLPTLCEIAVKFKKK